jgi:hypothetical protein
VGVERRVVGDKSGFAKDDLMEVAVTNTTTYRTQPCPKLPKNHAFCGDGLW